MASTDLFKRLSEREQVEFMEIIKEANLNYQQQVQLLAERENTVFEEGSLKTWKTAIIKKAAQILAAKIGSKSVADITNYLFEWEDDLKQRIENYLVEKVEWNRTAKHWTAKSIMIILIH